MELSRESAAMALVVGQPTVPGPPSPAHFPPELARDSELANRAVPTSVQDYTGAVKLDTNQGNLLDCRVPSKVKRKSDCVMGNKKNIIRTKKNLFILPKNKCLTDSLASVFISSVDKPLYRIKLDERLINQERLLKVNGGPRMLNRRTSRKKELECFKCEFCPLMTLKREMMVLHMERKGACLASGNVTRCPGCANSFYSSPSLRVHLTHDHNMLPNDVKRVLERLQRVKVTQLGEEDRGKVRQLGEEEELVKVTLLGEVEERGKVRQVDEEEEKSSCVYSQLQDRPSCTNGKRSTLLENFLDDINSKTECSVRSRLAQGDDLLEHTFNFTAPVDEQLPSIQPEVPPAASKLDQHHLMNEEGHLMNEDGHLMNEDGHLMNEEGHLDQGLQSGELADGQIGQLIIQAEDQGNFITSGQEILGSREQTEEPVLIEGEILHQSHILDAPAAQHFLAMSSAYHQQETYDEENLEYVYIDEDISVIRLDDKQAFDFPPLKEKTPPAKKEEDKASKRISPGFRCDINGCKFRMQSEDNIKYHRRCHEGQVYNCPECCKDCANWVSLSSHLWQKHKIDMELFKCDLCPYRTPSYSRLTNIHRGIHGDARPFLCDICGKGFKTVKQMRNHKIIHKAKMMRSSYNMDCGACGRSFVNKRVLDQHVKNLHTKLKPFLCNTCGYTTAVKHSLNVHMRTHTGEKPHKCDKCDYQTADHNALRRHLMKHSGAAKYKCYHCPYTCIQASSYKLHVKQKHPGMEQGIIFSCEHCTFETLQRGKYLTHSALHADPLAYYPSLSTDQAVTVDLSSAQSLLEEGYYNVDDVPDENLQPPNAASISVRLKS